MLLNESKMRIACAFNDAYAPHFVTLAASLAATHGREEIHISILMGTSLTADIIHTIDGYLAMLGISVEFLRIPEASLASLPQSALYSSETWFRLFLPSLLPACPKVLYLDTDTLVLQNLWPLYEEQLGTNIIAAVATPIAVNEGHCERIGIDPAHGYFNGGIQLMNLQLMRDENFTEQALQIGQVQYKKLTFADQDVFNILARGRWKKLHPKWNAISYLWLDPQVADDSYSALEYSVATHSPAIVHFEGPHTVKPWYFRSVHPLRMLYRQFRSETPWPLKELEGRSLAMAFLRLLPLKWQYFISGCKTKVLSIVRTQK
jgi:lipopolysaccharide biosynthesis glycosyltransferase